MTCHAATCTPGPPPHVATPQFDSEHTARTGTRPRARSAKQEPCRCRRCARTRVRTAYICGARRQAHARVRGH
jgi:hypothetical protein